MAQGFRFLDLPPELRNLVYFCMESLNARLYEHEDADGLTVADGANSVWKGKWYSYYDPPSLEDSDNIRPPVQPNITKVCRQMRRETLPIFYGANGFRIFDGYRRDVGRQSTQFIGVICKWLKQISNHLHLISRLQVQTGPLSTQPATDTIAALAYIYPQLKEGVLKGYDSYDDVD